MVTKKKSRLKPRKPPQIGRQLADDVEEEREARKVSPSEAAEAEEDYFGDDAPAPKSKKKADTVDTEDVSGDGDDREDEPMVKPRRKKVRGEDGKILVKAAGKGVSVPMKRIVCLDTRKLSKKDEIKLANWQGRTRGKALDAFFRGQVAETRKKFGHSSVHIGDEVKNLIVGIPMFGGRGPDAAKYPGCLPMEFVIAQDCFPLGLVWQLVAKHGVGKSGLLAEFGRWFYLAGGGMNLCEAEDKFNPNWYESIMGSEFFPSLVPLFHCKSVEDWQRKLSGAIKSAKSQCVGTKENPGPGRTVPIMFGIDSIMGKQSEETQEQIFGTSELGIEGRRKGKGAPKSKPGLGHGSRGFPIEAQVITRYMRSVPGRIEGWPFSLVLVNHLRIKTDEAGNLERSKAGGEQVNFQESFELELKKVGGHKKKIESADFDGFPLQISCEKNSFGPTHRSIQTRVLWWDEENEETGAWEQRTVWDWDWSTIHLLHSIKNGERASPRLKQALKDIEFHLDCPESGEVNNTAWSKDLGMTKDDAMSWSEVGALIREDPKLMARLRKALRINPRPLLQGDYLAQLDTISEDLP